MSQIKYILTDIEGTTTSIDFVHQTLFPYSIKYLPSYVLENESSSDAHTALQGVRDTLASENDLQDAHTHTCIETLLHWVAIDRKHPSLKALQGLVWQAGYEQGDYQGHVYPEVPEVLRQWKAEGYCLGVYSSGSVAAQRLLFAHTAYGDLTSLFSHYFDTAVGGKTEVASYSAIASQLSMQPKGILFLSDIEAELEAAEDAGFSVVQLQRNENMISGHVPYPVRRDFNGVSAWLAAKNNA